MKILSVEILPSWNELVAANTENKDMPEGENR